MAIKRIVRSRAAAPKRVTRTRKTHDAPRPYYAVNFSASWGELFQLYLMTSFLYYEMNRSVISNDDYDRICGLLAAGWRGAKHQHKHLITLEDLTAVTGYAIRYPSMVVGGALTLLKLHSEV